MNDSKFGWIIAATVIVLAVIGFAVYDSAHAADTLPDGVSKFTDGTIVCYVLDKYDYSWGTANIIGGISCIK